MYIEQKYADVALRHTDAKMKALGVAFDPQTMEKFRATLRNISETKKYGEGQEIDSEHWALISSNFEELMQALVNGVAAQSKEFRRNVNANDYVLSAHDYLIALISSELGGPEIPVSDFRPRLAGWVSGVVFAKPDTEISLEECYTAQRGVNAADLEANTVNPLIDQINNDSEVPEKLGRLFAEYRALAQRQASHSVFWSLLYRKENVARKNLLEKMEDVLKSYIPNSSLDSWTPAEIVKVAEKAIAKTKALSASMQYQLDPSAIFGYYECTKNYDPLECKSDNKSEE